MRLFHSVHTLHLLISTLATTILSSLMPRTLPSDDSMNLSPSQPPSPHGMNAACSMAACVLVCIHSSSSTVALPQKRSAQSKLKSSKYRFPCLENKPTVYWVWSVRPSPDTQSTLDQTSRNYNFRTSSPFDDIWNYEGSTNP